MIRSALTVTIPVFLSLAAPAAAQKTFEGMVTYASRTPDGKSGMLRYYQLEGRTRQEFEAGGAVAVSITDASSGHLVVLIPERKQYMVMKLTGAGDPMTLMAEDLAGGGAGGGMGNPPDISKMKVTTTGLQEAIAGIQCGDYHFAAADPNDQTSADVCAATGMGFLGQGAVIPSTEALLNSGPDLAKLASQGFFPLKITMTNGVVRTSMEATVVDRKKPEPSLFVPPPGFSQISLGGENP
jgi:hypothetical protein